MNDISRIEIVLIEDNPNDAELTMRALKKNNITNNIVLLEDGEAAINYFFNPTTCNDHETPKLILLDLKLPKIGGIEVLQRLKNNERTRLVPVVVLTSSKEEPDVVESYRLGVNSYITKPVDFDKFISAISTMGLYWLLLNQPPS